MSFVRHVLFRGLLAAGLPSLCGCGGALTGSLASLGSGTAGGRGATRVLFINNTPQQAVFTFGSYDPLDQFSEPDFDQFSLDEAGRTLEGNSESAILVIRCARVLGIGSPQLLKLIEQNLPDVGLNENALIEGIEFFDVSPDDDDLDRIRVGRALPFEARLGLDFPCGSLVIIRFEFSEQGPDPFFIDFEFIPSDSTR